MNWAYQLLHHFMSKSLHDTTGVPSKYPCSYKRHTHHICKQPIPKKYPNVYQHEISIVTEGTDKVFPLIAVMNLDFAKTLHIGKGEIVGFARF